jgi:hypothetical protein
MQMAQQAGQIPQQLGGVMGAGPQGFQGAAQQASQLAGQFGKQDKGFGELGRQGDDARDGASGPDEGERAPVAPSEESDSGAESAPDERPEAVDSAGS